MGEEKDILIADYDRITSRILEKRLTREGYEVFPVEDGQRAIQTLQEQLPRLVITEVMLPFRNGLEVLETVKSKKQDTPVIVLTSAGQENTVSNAFELGADDYMTKPFNIGELLHRIKRFLKNERE